jgi:hypothetical protein
MKSTTPNVARAAPLARESTFSVVISFSPK